MLFMSAITDNTRILKIPSKIQPQETRIRY